MVTVRRAGNVYGAPYVVAYVNVNGKGQETVTDGPYSQAAIDRMAERWADAEDRMVWPDAPGRGRPVRESELGESK